jgi:catechol 2,3-dioxygenase-like lactoylglutathione lyase family enzyme
MDMKLEVVVVPVSDVDQSKEFYKALGWRLDAGGVFHHAGTEGRVSAPDPARHSYGSFLSFSDQDGNGWVLQEVTTRLPGRIDEAATGFASADDLAGAMRRAAKAHGEHETRIGQEDPDWPAWHAEHMVREQAGTELPS